MIGLVVNPVAGVGGPAGLAGSDGADVQRLALARGARSRVQERAAGMLQVLVAQHPSLVIVTAAGAMGADAARAAGLVPRVVYETRPPREGACDREETPTPDTGRFVTSTHSARSVQRSLRSLNDRAPRTDAADTSRAVAAVAAAGADLILVVGGDGTLRDAVTGLEAFTTPQEPADSAAAGPDPAESAPILRISEPVAGLDAFTTPEIRAIAAASAGERAENPPVDDPDAAGSRSDIRSREPRPAVLGVPAGVKMYSPVFAVSPSAAGALAADWVSRGALPTEEREVLDIDEAAMRGARVDPTLHGFLRVPYRLGRTQARKAPTPVTEAAAVEAAARGAVARMRSGVRYLLGPGGTTAEIARQMGVEGSPLGVDVVLDGELLARAASEKQLLVEIAKGPAQAVVTVIGGQGFLLGRGNQQLSASVLRALGDDPLIVVSPEQKLIDLNGRPLLVDTGDPEVDERLAGHIRVVTGVGTSSLYAVAAPELVPTR